MSHPPSDQELQEAFARLLRTLHGRWQLALLAPAAYLGGAVLLMKYVLEPQHGGRGFLPLPQEVYLACLFLSAALIFLLWRLLDRVQVLQLRRLKELRDDLAAFSERARSNQLQQLLLCDLAASPGIFLFLLQGEPLPLLVSLVASMVLYLRAFPSGRRLGEALFRPDLVP